MKKVIDILPPKELEKEEIEEVLLEKKGGIRFKKPEIRIKTPAALLGEEDKSSSSPFRVATKDGKEVHLFDFAAARVKKGLFFSLFVLILIGIFCYFTLSKAEVGIWPETKILNSKTRLTIDKRISSPDFSANIIPGKIFEKEKTVAKVFSASGKLLKEKKAEGIVRAYNSYSTSPQVLLAKTRFVSVEGKVFRTLTQTTIPGGRYEKGKLVPGEIDIKVAADQPGPEYNIGPSTFSIPGFAGTDRYTKFYAKSSQAMTGGLREEVARVTKEDLSRAEELLVKQAKKECEDSLKDESKSEKISSEFYFLEDTIQTEILERFSPARPEDELKEFNFQVKAKSQALLFKKEDLKNFAKESILSQVPEGKKLHEESLKIDYSGETIDFGSGKIILSLDISAKTYSDIDTSSLKNSLLGKSLTESKIFLENQPGIAKVDVKFWPFWVRKSPQDPEKVEIRLNID